MIRLLPALAVAVLSGGCHVFEKDYMERLGRLVEISAVMEGAGETPPATQPAPATQAAPP